MEKKNVDSSLISCIKAVFVEARATHQFFETGKRDCVKVLRVRLIGFTKKARLRHFFL
jgi:hypothetical protein